MEFGWDAELLAFRGELDEFIRAWRTPELLEEYRSTHGGRGPLTAKFQDALLERGWMRMCWPVEYGGLGRDPLYQFVFIETMEYWGMPYGNLTYTSIAPAILRHGSDAQKKKYLPGIWRGELRFAIGYSEPNAGTDLAALRTRGARRRRLDHLRPEDLDVAGRDRDARLLARALIPTCRAIRASPVHRADRRARRDRAAAVDAGRAAHQRPSTTPCASPTRAWSAGWRRLGDRHARAEPRARWGSRRPGTSRAWYDTLVDELRARWPEALADLAAPPAAEPSARARAPARAGDAQRLSRSRRTAPAEASMAKVWHGAALRADQHRARSCSLARAR
jgi:hypothetical protein